MENILYLKHNKHCFSFLKTLRDFQQKERLCDSTLVCHGKYYQVHRLVLSLSSEYFEEIYEKTPCKHPFLILNDIESEQLEAILNFIYQGEIKVPRNKFPQFIKAAETLKIKGLIWDNSNSPKNSHNNEEHQSKFMLERNISDENASTSSIVSADENIQFNDLKSCLSQSGDSCTNRKQDGNEEQKNSPVILDPVLSLPKLRFCEAYTKNRALLQSSNLVSKYQYQNGVKDQKLWYSKKRMNPYNIKRRVNGKSKNLDDKDVKFKYITATSAVKENVDESENETSGLRKSSRIRKQVNYFCDDGTIDINADHQQNTFKNRSDLSSEIQISSYSGSNHKEFVDKQSSANDKFEHGSSTSVSESANDIAIKIEPTEEISLEERDISFDVTQIKIEHSEDGEMVAASENNMSGPLLTENATLKDNFHSEFDDNTAGLNEPGCSFSEEVLDVGEKLPYSKILACRFCPFIGINERVRKRHEDTHFSMHFYACKFCWYRTMYKSNLNAHMRHYHMSKKAKERLCYRQRKRVISTVQAGEDLKKDIQVNDDLNEDIQSYITSNSAISEENNTKLSHVSQDRLLNCQQPS